MSKSTIRGVLTALFVVPLLGFLVLGHGTPTVRVAASQASDNKSDDDHNGENCDSNGHDSAEESHESDQAEMNEHESKSEEANESDSDESAEESHEADDDCDATSSTMKATTSSTAASSTTNTAGGSTSSTAAGSSTTNGPPEDVCETDGLLAPETIADQLVDGGVPLNEPEADGPISSAIVSSLGALAPISSEAACVVSLLTL